MMDSPDCEPIFEDEVDLRAAYIWFKVKKTQVEIMRDRGLIIPEEEKFLLEYDPEVERVKEWELKALKYFVEKYKSIADAQGINFNSALSNAYLDESTEITTVAIYLCRKRESSSITTGELTSKFEYYRSIYYEDGKRLKMMFISEVDLNKNEEKVSCLNYISCQFFITRELIINPTQHIFYYPHHLLDEEERRTQLAENGIDTDQLPIIKKTDPIVKYYDWPLEGVVKIDRTEKYLEVPAPKGYYLRVIK